MSEVLAIPVRHRRGPVEFLFHLGRLFLARRARRYVGHAFGANTTTVNPEYKPLPLAVNHVQIKLDNYPGLLLHYASDNADLTHWIRRHLFFTVCCPDPDCFYEPTYGWVSRRHVKAGLNVLMSDAQIEEHIRDNHPEKVSPQEAAPEVGPTPGYTPAEYLEAALAFLRDGELGPLGVMVEVGYVTVEQLATHSE